MISIKNKQKMYKTHFLDGNTSQKQFYQAYTNKLTKAKFKSKQVYYQDELKMILNTSLLRYLIFDFVVMMTSLRIFYK